MKFQYAEHRLYIVRLIFQHHLEIINWHIVRDATNTLVSKTFTFDDGLYSLDVIHFKLSRFTAQIANGHDSQLIFFFPDESSSRIYVSFSQTNVSVDATATNSILISLGFTKFKEHMEMV